MHTCATPPLTRMLTRTNVLPAWVLVTLRARALQDLVLAEDEFALARPLLRLEHLQRLTLAGSDSTHMPVKLEWLKGVNQLQHLSACMVQSSQVSV